MKPAQQVRQAARLGLLVRQKADPSPAGCVPASVACPLRRPGTGAPGGGCAGPAPAGPAGTSMSCSDGGLPPASRIRRALRRDIAWLMSARIERDFADSTTDGGGKLMVGAVGMHFAGGEADPATFAALRRIDWIAPRSGLAHIDSPVRRDGPAVNIGGALDVIEFGLAAHVRLGARHRRQPPA